VCKELLPQLYDREAWKAAQEAAALAADPKGKAKAKAKGKASKEPVPVEEEPPPPPFEEATLELDIEQILQLPAVSKALSTHGGMLCRKRAIDAFYPPGGGGLLVSSEYEYWPTPLTTLIPPPEVPPPT